VGFSAMRSLDPFYIGVIKKMPRGFLSAFLVFSLSSCLYDKSGSLTPTSCSTSPTSQVSFSRDIFPIIQANCLQCHDAKNHYDGIVIENYSQIAESGKSGELYNSIQINSSTGKPYMPKGGRLLDCEIALIQAWIKQGALNN
jgi:uncharacterized membrane protein